jgi:hypothetical protein
LILVILGASIVLLVPSSPRITATFEIVPVNGYSAKLKVDYSTYDKVSIGAAWGSTRNTPVLTLVSGSQGVFLVHVTVTYGLEVIASTPTPFSNLGTGLYQVTVTFFPRQETAGVPYAFTISLFRNTSTLDSITFSVFPA